MQQKKTIKKITLIVPRSNIYNLLSAIIMPRYGITILGTILRDEGFDIQIFVEDIGPIDWKRVFESDLIGFQVMGPAHNRTKEIISKIKKVKDVPIVLGGTHPTNIVEECLEFSDFVVRQEGDETLPELIKALNNNLNLREVLGVSYKVNDKIVHNPNRPPVKEFDKNPDISLMQHYPRKSDLKLLLEKRFRLLALQTSRGCPFNCSFCPAAGMFGRGYRMRSIDSVIKDIKYQLEFSKGGNFIIVDNNFTANKERTKALLTRIIDEKINAFFAAFVRLDVAEDEELLKLLHKAGVLMLYIGFESINDETLNKYNKKQTLSDIKKAVSVIQKHKIDILASFVLGADDDTKETVRETANFAISSNFAGLYMFCLGEYPNRLENRLLPIQRTFQYNWDYLNGNFVTFFPKRMKPSTLQKELIRGHNKFYATTQIAKALLMGQLGKAGHRMLFKYNWYRVNKEVKQYLPYLEKVEQGLYDENEILIEAKLKERLK